MAQDLRKLLFEIAKDLTQNEVKLLAAIIQVESGWQPSRMRYEPSFIYLYNSKEFALKNGIDVTTERTLQRFSYGLAQVMGGTARELGFTGPLPDLLDPSTNLTYMLAYYNKRCKTYAYLADKIAAYNHGFAERRSDGNYVNQGYVNKVLSAINADPLSTGAAT